LVKTWEKTFDASKKTGNPRADTEKNELVVASKEYWKGKKNRLSCSGRKKKGKPTKSRMRPAGKAHFGGNAILYDNRKKKRRDDRTSTESTG